MRNATRDHCKAASPELLLATVDVDENFAFQHVQGLVDFGVRMHWRGLADRHDVVEQQECASRLGVGSQPGVNAATVEPQLLAITVGTHDRN